MFQPPKYESPRYHLYILHISIFCVKSTCFWFRQNTWCDVNDVGLPRKLLPALVADSGADALDAVLAALGAACSISREDFPAPEDGKMLHVQRAASPSKMAKNRSSIIIYSYIYRQFKKNLNFRLPGLITREERFWGTVLGETRLVVAIHEGFQPG